MMMSVIIMNKDNFILYEWNYETKEFWFLGEKIDYINNPTEWRKYLNNLVEENKQLKENNQSMQEEMCRTWEKLAELNSILEEYQKENKFLKLTNPEQNIEHFRMLKENKVKIDNLRRQNKELKERCDTYEIQRNRWKKHSHKFAMKCDKYRINLSGIERYIKEHLTDNGRFLMLNEWQVQELLQKIDDGRKWINGRN